MRRLKKKLHPSTVPDTCLINERLRGGFNLHGHTEFINCTFEPDPKTGFFTMSKWPSCRITSTRIDNCDGLIHIDRISSITLSIKGSRVFISNSGIVSLIMTDSDVFISNTEITGPSHMHNTLLGIAKTAKLCSLSAQHHNEIFLEYGDRRESPAFRTIRLGDGCVIYVVSSTDRLHYYTTEEIESHVTYGKVISTYTVATNYEQVATLPNEAVLIPENAVLRNMFRVAKHCDPLIEKIADRFVFGSAESKPKPINARLIVSRNRFSDL